MKKPVILWIVAALFLFCSFPFFGEGNIGAGVTGIVIAAALGVFGYVTMKKAQAAAEAEQHRGNAGSKACQRNNNDLIQESIPDLKMSEQLIPVAYCFPFA